MQISRGNYIRQRVDELIQQLEAQAAQEWDEQEAAWLASLPSHPQMGAYLQANGLGHASEGRWEEWDEKQHGTRESVEAAVDAWVAEREAAAAAEAEAQGKREAEQARVSAEAEAAKEAEREELAARLEAVRAKPTTANTGALLLVLAEKLGLA